VQLSRHADPEFSNAWVIVITAWTLSYLQTNSRCKPNGITYQQGVLADRWSTRRYLTGIGY